MTTFTASDGSTLHYDARPTLRAIVELFNFVYELQVNNGPGADTLILPQPPKVMCQRCLTVCNEDPLHPGYADEHTCVPEGAGPTMNAGPESARGEDRAAGTTDYEYRD